MSPKTSRPKRDAGSINISVLKLASRAEGYGRIRLVYVALKRELLDVSNRWHINAKLQRHRLFTTASAQSNSRNDDSEHDSTLHSILSFVVLALPPALSERAA